MTGDEQTYFNLLTLLCAAWIVVRVIRETFSE